MPRSEAKAPRPRKPGARGPRPGAPRKAGRSTGTPNKKSQLVAERIAATGLDPITAMCIIALSKDPCPLCDTKGKIVVNKKSVTCPECLGRGRRLASLELKSQVCKELAQYMAPKRKAIEVSSDPDNPFTIRGIEVSFVDGQG